MLKIAQFINNATYIACIDVAKPVIQWDSFNMFMFHTNHNITNCEGIVDINENIMMHTIEFNYTGEWDGHVYMLDINHIIRVSNKQFIFSLFSHSTPSVTYMHNVITGLQHIWNLHTPSLIIIPFLGKCENLYCANDPIVRIEEEYLSAENMHVISPSENNCVAAFNTSYRQKVVEEPVNPTILSEKHLDGLTFWQLDILIVIGFMYYIHLY